jgi:hypothetical protein
MAMSSSAVTPAARTADVINKAAIAAAAIVPEPLRRPSIGAQYQPEGK